MTFLLTAVFGLAIGAALGLLGAGGSILAIPALVYGVGLPLSSAIPTSLLVVAVSAGWWVFAAVIGIWLGRRQATSGPIANLLVGRAVPAYRIKLRPPTDGVAAALRALPWVTGVEPDGPDTLRCNVSSLAEAESRLPGALAEAGARVVSLAPLAPDLEDVFLELTS